MDGKWMNDLYVMLIHYFAAAEPKSSADKAS